MGSRIALLRKAERFVGVGIVHQGARREVADVDDEFWSVKAAKESEFVGDRFSVGKGVVLLSLEASKGEMVGAVFSKRPTQGTIL